MFSEVLHLCLQVPAPLDEHNARLLDNVRPASWIDPKPESRCFSLHALCAFLCKSIIAGDISFLFSADSIRFRKRITSLLVESVHLPATCQ